jgi:MFS family permease
VSNLVIPKHELTTCETPFKNLTEGQTVSGFASNIYFPAIPTIAQDLDVSTELINLTVTSYLIFQGLAPSLWGPISDVKGRRVAYGCTFLVFLGACIGLALSQNYPTLFILRCLQSTGSASTIAIGSGVIGDITTRSERGGFMGVFQAGLLAPVAVGPVIGGALSGALGWRAVFRFLTIYSGVFLIILLIFLPETLRSIVSNGGRKPSNLIAQYPLALYQKNTKVDWHQDTDSFSPDARKHVDLAGPFRILVRKQASPLILFLSIYYAVWQMSITVMSTFFDESYNLTETEIGLTFIANGFGSIIGTLTTGKILDIDYRRVKAAYETRTISTNQDQGFPLERARLRLIPIFAILQCLSILLFGWTINYPKQVHIAVPIVSTFITGWTAVSTQSTIMTYLVDVFHTRSAAASASLNLGRCLFAAGGTSFITPMINGVGVGVAFTICTAVQVLAMVGIFVQFRYGPQWRVAAERQQKET